MTPQSYKSQEALELVADKRGLYIDEETPRRCRSLQLISGCRRLINIDRMEYGNLLVWHAISLLQGEDLQVLPRCWNEFRAHFQLKSSGDARALFRFTREF
ncbi:hypothetical protein AVEN_95672-1 [Araneus ventricosus]|uniref:Uncharacterized protein n=1 Tax=Araneus ventricosus TaxID=182803 RepID=A0A4Y2J4J3_ARAVE|nr:hypothetical protein AVEN_95672-1 [Araneus ventricosus]